MRRTALRILVPLSLDARGGPQTLATPRNAPCPLTPSVREVDGARPQGSEAAAAPHHQARTTSAATTPRARPRAPPCPSRGPGWVATMAPEAPLDLGPGAGVDRADVVGAHARPPPGCGPSRPWRPAGAGRSGSPAGGSASSRPGCAAVAGVVVDRVDQLPELGRLVAAQRHPVPGRPVKAVSTRKAATATTTAAAMAARRRRRVRSTGSVSQPAGPGTARRSARARTRG